MSNSMEEVYTIHHLKSDTGTGQMQCYDVAPGIQISYNNLNMDSCFQPITYENELMEINYCIEGCYEIELVNGSVNFLGEGDLAVSHLSKEEQVFTNSRIPFKKYRGITITLEMELAQKTLNKDFQQAKIDLISIKNNLCENSPSLLIKSRHEIDYIFRQLYSVNESIQLPFLWIKTIELLLYLSLLDNTCVQRPQQFSTEVSQGTQAAYQYIIENPFSNNTIADLSKMFNVAESSMKRCFKSLSGNSIGTFIKIKRMEAAAELLVAEPKLSIGEIAEITGYKSQSKFSSAFKSVLGITPFAYRSKSW